MSKSTARGLLLLAAVILCVSLAVPAQADDFTSARDAILYCYDNLLESVDLSRFGLSEEQLDQLFDELSMNNALPWYAQRYSYTYDQDTGIVQTFSPLEEDYSAEERSLYEQKVAEILDITVHPGMSQWQMALSIHDYLVANSCYDESRTYRHGYDLLVRGTAVCNGYTEAYMDLLKRVGIPCVKVISEPMNHDWNLVQIDGNWYHVDVTWDDPTTDKEGYVGHSYFLVSDSVISDENHEHYSWETDTVCSDTSMDTGCFWEDVTSQICYLDAGTSFVRYMYQEDNLYIIYRRDENTGDVTQMAKLPMDYINLGQGGYWYFNDGLTLWNGRVYYSDMERVYSMSAAGGDQRTEFYHNAQEDKRYIRGSSVRDGQIYMTLSTHDNALKDVRFQLEDAVFHEHSYTPYQTQATCTSGGYTTYTCFCGVSYVSGHTPLSEHVYDDSFSVQGVIDGLLGTRYLKCLYCDAVIEADLLESGDETPPAPNVTDPAPEPDPGPEPEKKGILDRILTWLHDSWEKSPMMTVIKIFGIYLVLRWLLSPASPKKK